MSLPQLCFERLDTWASRLQKEKEVVFGEKDQRPSNLPAVFKAVAKKQLKSEFGGSEFQNKNSNK